MLNVDKRLRVPAARTLENSTPFATFFRHFGMPKHVLARFICAHSSKPRKLLHSKRKEAGNNENKTEDYDFLLRSDIVFPVDFLGFSQVGYSQSQGRSVSTFTACVTSHNIDCSQGDKLITSTERSRKGIHNTTSNQFFLSNIFDKLKIH